MKIINNFLSDWYNELRLILSSHYSIKQSDIDSITDEDLPFVYMNVEARRLVAGPRTVLESDVFNCPSTELNGWNALKAKIQSGADLTPYLSKLTSKPNSKDKLLFDWSIYHFHLGTNMIGDYIERTGSLVFAIVSEQCVYAVDVYTHKDWAEDSILNTVYRNWPEIMARYKINGIEDVSWNPTPQERIQLRNSNANSFFKAHDNTIYAPIGGGMVSSGYSLNSVRTVLKTKEKIEQLTELANNPPEELISLLKQNGVHEGQEIQANLIFSEDDYRFYFESINIDVIVHKRDH